jgi:hypothetical protein
MSQIASISAHDSAACLAARSGAYLLAPAQALGLQPTKPSSLRITCGQAWVTLGDGKDHFLQAGQTLLAPMGSHVVLESLYGTVLKFDWQALPAKASAPHPLHQALRDLRAAAALAARGLLGLGLGLAALARSAASKASRAHSRIASGESMASSGAV